MVSIGGLVLFTTIGVLTSPTTWCEHEDVIIEEVNPTCTTKGKVVKQCALCERKAYDYPEMLPHSWQTESFLDATCTAGGYSTVKCSVCSTTQRTDYTALGHSMKEISRNEPTNDTDGEIVLRCERCGHEEISTIPHTNPETNNNSFISDGSTAVGGEIFPDIVSDNLVNELMELGFTKEEATPYRAIFLKCGIDSIVGAAPTDPNANIDGLVAYRIVLDDDRILWFTIDKRELFYIGLNGVDVYDTSKGGFLINIDDIHIPENDISIFTAQTLKDKTISVIDRYFINALWYDGFRYGRSDDTYAVQCEVYASNRLGIKDWVFAKVWYEYDGTDFVVTAIVIDGVRYK